MSFGGILLCGGKGTRLFPTTKYLNKHLIPVYDKPMVYYSISILLLSGVKEITIVINPDDRYSFEKLLGNGEEFGINILYSEQDSPKGIPHAINTALEVREYDRFMVVLGDNFIFGEKFFTRIESVLQSRDEVVIFSQHVNNPELFGVIKFDKKGDIQDIIEKPKEYVSNSAVTGIYIFDKTFKNKFEKISLSKRGEYEIADILHQYGYSNLSNIPIGRGTAWFDMGTMEDFYACSSFIKTVQQRQGYLVCSPHEIAIRNKWINKNQFTEYLEKIKNSEYYENLLKVLSENI